MAKPHITTAPANSTTWVELVNTDMEEVTPGGRLKGVAVTAGNHEHSVRVTIDSSLSTGDRFSQPTTGFSNNGMTFDLPFEDRLVVEVKDDTAYAYTRFWATYVTNGSQLVEDSLSTQDEKVYRERIYEHNGGRYSVTALVGSKNVAVVDFESEVEAPERSTVRIHFRTFDESSEPEVRQRDQESEPRVNQAIGERPGRWKPTEPPETILIDVRDPFTHHSVIEEPLRLETRRFDVPQGTALVDVPLDQIDFNRWVVFGPPEMIGPPIGLELGTAIDGYENYPDRLLGPNR